MEMICPKCGSSSTYKSKKYNAWICEDCGEKFTETVVASRKWNDDLENADYWNDEFISVAPISLAVSYKKLKEYVVNGNIGCTLFLIRDVFELMIKIPVVIILDGVYSTLETTNDVQKFLAEHPKFKALYANSMQILTTGKWWECVRLGAGLIREFGKDNWLSGESDLVYQDTALYLEKIYKMFWFQIPGQAKVNMVSWRNRAVGHSCLASNPEENYAEIPYILKMLRKVCDVSVPYYQKVSLADANHNILNGTNSAACDDKIFVAYLGGAKRLYTQIHSFVAGKIENLAYYDGYEKGKAYLLNYADGDRYKDIHLSKYIEEMSASSEAIYFSENSIDADNLETADIQQLETELSEEDKVVTIPYLYRWVINSTDAVDRGIFLLQAERGMGKSTFCNTINQLSDSENVLWYSEQINEWADFMEKSAIRVWHFNSTYFGRKDVYLPGIRDALLTLTTGHFENKKWIEANRLIGRLTSMWDSLEDSEFDLRHIYFAEAMNATFEEYLARSDKERLILVLDGIDELSDPETLMSYIPNSSELSENIYIVLTTRTDNELPEVFKSKEILGKRAYNASLTFKRTNIIVKVDEQTVEKKDNNDYYCEAIDKYILGSFGTLSENRGDLVKRFDNRFSELAAYKALCKMNAAFTKTEGNNLLETFVDTLRKNSPEFYCKKVEMILNALAWSGSSLTIRELAYLSGEQYVTYRFIGMLHDLKAFIKVVRTDRGNCYEFAHSEWEQSVKKKYPFGDIYFRGLCNKLLEEIKAEDSDKDFLCAENQGELWILTNLLRVYNEAYNDIKENWYEDVKIDSLIEVFLRFLRGKIGYKIINNSTDMNIRLLDLICSVFVDYNAAIIGFSDIDRDGIECSSKSIIGSEFTQFLSTMISGSDIDKIMHEMLEDGNFNERIGVLERVGEMYGIISSRHHDTHKKQEYVDIALKCYHGASNLCFLRYTKEKKEEYLISQIKNLYHCGRICYIVEMNDRALKYMQVALSTLYEYDEINADMLSSMMFITAKVFIRYAILVDDFLEKEHAFCSAESIINKLLNKAYACEYVEIRARLFENLATLYDKVSNINKSAYYWNKALEDCERLYIERGTRTDEYAYLHSLQELLNIEVKRQEWMNVVILAERLLKFERDKLSWLKILSQAYAYLEKYQEKSEVDKKVSEIEEKNMRYADAYQEVIEILKHTKRDDVNRIPKAKILLWRSRANKEHGFKVNPALPFEQQQVMKETRAILANVFYDYWATGKQKQKIDERDGRDRAAARINLLNHIWSNDIPMGVENYNDIYCDSECREWYDEIDIVLSNIPRSISLLIPVEILKKLGMRKTNKYDKSKFSVWNPIIQYPETIVLIKSLLQKYIPDGLIEKEIAGVPEKIDLSIIFDNPEFED